MRKIWSCLGSINSAIASNISKAIILAVPILATIDSIINNNELPSGLYSKLLYIFEDMDLHIPVNMVRIYLASILYYASYLLFKIAAPRFVFMPLEKWRNTTECANLIEELKKERPGIVQAQIDIDINNIYFSKEIKFLEWKNIVLILIILTTICSSYLLILVLLTNIGKIFPACDLFLLLSYAAKSC